MAQLRVGAGLPAVDVPAKIEIPEFSEWLAAAVLAACGLTMRGLAVAHVNRFQRELKEMLRHEPAYDRLFAQYADATVVADEI